MKDWIYDKFERLIYVIFIKDHAALNFLNCGENNKNVKSLKGLFSPQTCSAESYMGFRTAWFQATEYVDSAWWSGKCFNNLTEHSVTQNISRRVYLRSSVISRQKKKKDLSYSHHEANDLRNRDATCFFGGRKRNFKL
jgi:hypothetical protein